MAGNDRDVARDVVRDVVVVGGGVIGLAIAWRAARGGLAVTVLDPTPGMGASHHGAGMLAPVTEVHYGEEDLLRLNLASAARYPSFVEELEESSGTTVGYRATGTLAVAFDADDKAALDDLHGYQGSLGLSSQPLGSRECRELEPYLSTAVRGGLLVDGDHQVDPRRLVAALLVACARAGVDVRHAQARQVRVEGDRVVGVDELNAGSVVLAAGCWSAGLGGLPPHALPPVRPVKGQILRLHDDVEHPMLARNVRALVRGRPVYLVPRADGEIVLGATSEDKGFDTRLTVEGTGDLLADARELLPRVSEVELVEASVGLRPGSPDNAPMIGAGALPGLVVATGHYRNGILLAPITADAVADLLTAGSLPGGFDRFDPCRFARARFKQATVPA
ncbi:MAG TPA: glycine oxidase ThiO [Acidothermaceae bacterium]|nr:glycine oxidase ThiO [Acidothermaceae bacterium]